MPISLASLFAPRWVKIAAGIAALLILLPILKSCYDSRVIADHEKDVKAEVETKASEGASAAASASASTKASVEAVNAKARDAAKGSSDPLRDGLGVIRKGG